MDRLRSPGRCPWDAAQSHHSLLPYLLEETYETVEAIEGGDRAHLREGLGELCCSSSGLSRRERDPHRIRPGSPPFGQTLVRTGPIADKRDSPAEHLWLSVSAEAWLHMVFVYSGEGIRQ